jgi:hypothetical protein
VTRQGELFRKLYGDGAFHPGEDREEKLGVQPGLKDYQAVIDVVTYIDGTADSTNNDALGRIIDERQATVASQKIAIDTIQPALADANDPDPSMTAAKKNTRPSNRLESTTTHEIRLRRGRAGVNSQ